jgi:hypothetical protein
VNSQVNLILSLGLLLLPHICLMLVVDEVNNRRPRVSVVHVVTKTRAVNDSEFGFELLFFEFSLNNLNLSQFVKLFVVTP